MQIINIAVGALTAGFATVVSFWLGSSSGSRSKDQIALRSQTQVAQMQRDSLSTTEKIVEGQSRQAASLITKIGQSAAVSPASSAGGASRSAAKDTRLFHRCVDIILGHEGGFVDHPRDPGGATNFGITLKTLAAWRDEPVTADDVREMTPEEARLIYRANYWNALNCDNLPPGVDLVCFDFGVNAGVGRAAKTLQKVVAVEADGQVGPITIGAVNQNDPDFVINAFSDARLEFYRGLKTFDTFGKGWTRRTNSTRQEALAMARG
jgi:hypothetical protein